MNVHAVKYVLPYQWLAIVLHHERKTNLLRTAIMNSRDYNRSGGGGALGSFYLFCAAGPRATAPGKPRVPIRAVFACWVETLFGVLGTQMQ